MSKYTWKDIIKVNGEIHAVEYPISGETISMDDGDFAYDCNDFFEAVANDYNIHQSEVQTYLFDNINFNPEGLSFGAEACGCYIDGVAEWCIDQKK